MQIGIMVALRKESVDRNLGYNYSFKLFKVALRKESVDRNKRYIIKHLFKYLVALRKESVDRNHTMQIVIIVVETSLSARRAWIEITLVQIIISG